MIIKKLKTQGVKVFSDTPFEVEFHPNLNVIFGLNRSGKSSLIDTIIAGLFGFSRKQKEYLNKRYMQSWKKTDHFYINIDIELNSDIYRITRDFNEKKEYIELQEKEEPGNIIDIGKFFRENLGIEDASFFLSTAILRQKDLNKTLENIKTVSNITQRLFVGSTEVDLEKLMNKLKEDRKNIRTESGKDRQDKKREYTVLTERLDELKGKLNRVKIKSEQIDNISETVKELEEEIPLLEEQYKQKKDLLDKVKKAKSIKTEIENLTTEHKKILRKINKIKKLNEQLEVLETGLEEFSGFEEIMPLIEDIDRKDEKRKNVEQNIEELEEEIDKLNEDNQKVEDELQTLKDFDKIEESEFTRLEFKIETLQKEKESLEEELNRQGQTIDEQKHNNYGKISLAGIILTIIFLASGLLTNKYLLIPGLFSVLISVLSGIKYFKKRTLIKDLNSDISKLEEELNQKDTEIEKTEEELIDKLNKLSCESVKEVSKKVNRYRELKHESNRLKNELDKTKNKLNNNRKNLERIGAEIDEVLEKAEMNDLNELKKAVDRFKNIKSEIKNKQTALKEASEEQAIDYWNKKRIDVESKIGIKQRQFEEEELEDFSYSNEEINEWQLKRDELNKSIKEKESKLSELKGKLVQLQEDYENLEDTESEIIEIEKQIKDLDILFDAYTIALDTLEEVKKEIEAEYQPLLEKYTNELFTKFVGDDFEELILNTGKKYKLKIVSEHKKDITEEELSLGTLEQLYFALRLASIKIIEKEKYPVIIDDSFANYDHTAEEKVLDMIKEISNERQVLFFTCHNRFFDWAKKLKSEFKNYSLFELNKKHRINRILQ